MLCGDVAPLLCVDFTVLNIAPTCVDKWTVYGKWNDFIQCIAVLMTRVIE